MLRTATLIVSLGCLAAQAGAAQTGEHATRVSAPAAGTAANPRLTALYQEMIAALARSDTATLARIWAPGYMYTSNSPDSTVVLTRAERLRATVHDTASAMDSARVEGCTIRTYATFAAGPCRGTLYVRDGSQRSVIHMLSTVLFTRGPGGRWQILATHTGELSGTQ